MKNTLLIICLSAVALTSGIFVRHSFRAAPLPQTTQLDFSLPDITGQLLSISKWQGKIRIINFWATWCPPCLKEIPEFIKLQQELGTKGVQFIGIAIEDQATVAEYLQTTPINYPILVGGDAGITLSQQLGNIVNAVPFTLIVNQQGQIIHRHPGELSRDKIIELITPLF